MGAEEQPWHRLELAAVTRRKTGGVTGYGFALLEAHSNHLLATGCGPVDVAVTYNQAAHIAALEGLRIAEARGVTRLLLQSDSSLVTRQLAKASSVPPHVATSLGAALQALSRLQEVEVEKVDRWANGLAIIQAEFATELLMLLGKVGGTPPSRYAGLAGQLGLLLQLPMAARRVLEAADNFADMTAQVVALRCGTSKADVLAAIHSSSKPPSPTASTTTAASSSAAVSANAATAAAIAAGSTDGLVASLVPFSLRRLYTPQEGAAYAAAALAAAADDEEVPALGDDTAAAAAAAGGGGDAPRLIGGRVVGRHRLTHRLLVVGFHKLPADWDQKGQQQQQQQVDDMLGEQQQQHSSSSSSSSSRQLPSEGSSQGQQQNSSVLVDDDSSAAGLGQAADAAAAANSGSAAAAAAAAAELEDVLLPSWAPTTGAASSSEGAGLGAQRYSLPHVSSDTATHLLQFDGASRNNPGRGGYGYVLFDLTSGRLVARGCMSLPYGQTAGRAEFEGLLAGLAAALGAGITHLAVQGDSALVLDAVMYRRGITSKDVSVAYQKAAQLLAAFDHVDFQYIPRHLNQLADRLANMSMDLDTALFALLRKDERGVPGLRVLTKAARMTKKQHQLELLLSHYGFPLLLVVLLQRVMSITPHQLLTRLADKAAHLGDPNPWLVQEVRKLVEAGIPDEVMAQVGAVIMDSRYKQNGMSQLRKAAAALTSQQRQSRVQSGGLPQLNQQTRLYCGWSCRPAAAGACEELVAAAVPSSSALLSHSYHHQQQQQQQQQNQQLGMTDALQHSNAPSPIWQLAQQVRLAAAPQAQQQHRLLLPPGSLLRFSDGSSSSQRNSITTPHSSSSSSSSSSLASWASRGLCVVAADCATQAAGLLHQGRSSSVQYSSSRTSRPANLLCDGGAAWPVSRCGDRALQQLFCWLRRVR